MKETNYLKLIVFMGLMSLALFLITFVQPFSMVWVLSPLWGFSILQFIVAVIKLLKDG